MVLQETLMSHCNWLQVLGCLEEHKHTIKVTRIGLRVGDCIIIDPHKATCFVIKVKISRCMHADNPTINF